MQRSNQLSLQANWELVIKLVRNIPGKDEDEIINVTLFGKTRLSEISVEPFLHLNAFSNVENALEIIFNAF